MNHAEVGKELSKTIDEELHRQGVYSVENHRVAVALLVGYLWERGTVSIELTGWRDALRDGVAEIKAGL